MEKKMNRYLFWLTLMGLGLILAACGASAAPAAIGPTPRPGAVTVEIAYLNHPPLWPVLAKVDQLVAGYGERVSVTRYDLGTAEGTAFAEARGLTGHTPLAIFVNGSLDFTVEGRSVKFFSFPQGQGTGVVPDGAWTLDDLQRVLDEATRKEP